MNSVILVFESEHAVDVRALLPEEARAVVRAKLAENRRAKVFSTKGVAPAQYRTITSLIAETIDEWMANRHGNAPHQPGRV